MVIYHLVVDVHTEKYGELQEQDSYFTDVFPTLDLAVERGKQEVKERIEKLFKADADYEDDELEDFIRENIRYTFKVYEFDPVRRNDRCWREDGKNITLENSVEFACIVEWEFDDKGIVIIRFEGRNVGWRVLPSDYQEDAGTHFIKGDLVTLKEPCLRRKENNPSDIYVVADAPGRRMDAKDPLRWENIYCVRYLYNGDEYSSGDHYHVHESELKHFQGELPSDSFLFVLSAFFKDESNFSKEAQERLYSLEAIYTCDLARHYKFIEGLQPRQSGDVSGKNEHGVETYG